jgi:hypothetical protein
LASTLPLYVKVINTGSIKLALTKADAVAGTNLLDIDGDGNSNQYFTTSILEINGHGNNNQRIMLANDGLDHNTALDNKAHFVAVFGLGGNLDGSGNDQAAHSGWVRKVVGQGGRAGRVQYETLVAMGMTPANSGDAADDTQFPDD